MHGRILPRRACNSCGFTMKMSSRYHRLLIYDVKRTTKIDGMGPFKISYRLLIKFQQIKTNTGISFSLKNRKHSFSFGNVIENFNMQFLNLWLILIMKNGICVLGWGRFTHHHCDMWGGWNLNFVVRDYSNRWTYRIQNGQTWYRG